MNNSKFIIQNCFHNCRGFITDNFVRNCPFSIYKIEGRKKVGTFKEYGRYIEDIRKLYARYREGISKVYPE